jgi:hypothetical protein
VLVLQLAATRANWLATQFAVPISEWVYNGITREIINNINCRSSVQLSAACTVSFCFFISDLTRKFPCPEDNVRGSEKDTSKSGLSRKNRDGRSGQLGYNKCLICVSLK